MLERIKQSSLRTRIFFLPLIFALGLIAMSVMNYMTNKEIMHRVVYPNFEEQLLLASKTSLKALVEAEATALAAKLKNVASREDKIAATITETDPIRFFR